VALFSIQSSQHQLWPRSVGSRVSPFIFAEIARADENIASLEDLVRCRIFFGASVLPAVWALIVAVVAEFVAGTGGSSPPGRMRAYSGFTLDISAYFRRAVSCTPDRRGAVFGRWSFFQALRCRVA